MRIPCWPLPPKRSTLTVRLELRRPGTFSDWLCWCLLQVCTPARWPCTLTETSKDHGVSWFNEVSFLSRPSCLGFFQRTESSSQASRLPKKAKTKRKLWWSLSTSALQLWGWMVLTHQESGKRFVWKKQILRRYKLKCFELFSVSTSNKNLLCRWILMSRDVWC